MIKKNKKIVSTKTDVLGCVHTIHMICTDENIPVIFSLSPGNFGDAPCGRDLIYKLGKQKKQKYLLMDRAYEGDETRSLAKKFNFSTVVPPISNRKNPWSYDHNLYKLRNNIERSFYKIKRFRRIFTRYDKIYSMFLSFVFFAFIVLSLLRVNTP